MMSTADYKPLVHDNAIDNDTLLIRITRLAHDLMLRCVTLFKLPFHCIQYLFRFTSIVLGYGYSQAELNAIRDTALFLEGRVKELENSLSHANKSLREVTEDKEAVQREYLGKEAEVGLLQTLLDELRSQVDIEKGEKSAAFDAQRHWEEQFLTVQRHLDEACAQHARELSELEGNAKLAGEEHSELKARIVELEAVAVEVEKYQVELAELQARVAASAATAESHDHEPEQDKKDPYDSEVSSHAGVNGKTSDRIRRHDSSASSLRSVFKASRTAIGLGSPRKKQKVQSTN